MARIRSMKPEFWEDEKLAPLAPIHRLVFLGLISQADDAGRLLDNVKRLDGLIFPDTEDTCRESLGILESLGRLSRGRSESGQKVIQIVHWSRHQRVDHPNLKSSLPEITQPNDTNGDKPSFASHSREIPEALAHHTNDQRPTTNDQLTTLSPSATFLATWETYWLGPLKRPGNSKAGGWRCWKARLRAGVTEEQLVAQTVGYADMVERDAVRPEHIQHAKTFYGPNFDPDTDYHVHDPIDSWIPPEARHA